VAEALCPLNRRLKGAPGALLDVLEKRKALAPIGIWTSP